MAYLNRPKKNKKARVPTSNQGFYNSRTWRRIRAGKLQVNPLCEVHRAKGVYIDCTSDNPIDHIVRISAPYNGHPLHDYNLLTLCESCHAKKSSSEAREGLLVNSIPCDGYFIPAPGEKERLISLMASKL